MTNTKKSKNNKPEKPRQLKLQAVGRCIYCGSTANISDEHIIPLSLGGLIVLPEASCDECAEKTSKFERSVSRDHLQIPRTIANYPTRRPKSRATETVITLEYPNGKKGKRGIPLSVAPTVNVVAIFSPESQNFWNEELRSACTLVGMHGLNYEKRCAQIREKYGASKLHVTSTSIVLKFWVRTLWKIAIGFFHVVAPKSLASSSRTLIVTDDDSASYMEADTNSDKALYWDIFSEYREPTQKIFGSARVLTRAEDTHSHVYCEIDMLSVLGFPLYTLRIPNLEEKKIGPVEFRVDEKSETVGNPLYQQFPAS